MPFIRSFFQLFWVACCALTLLAQTRLLLDQPLTPGWLDGFVFGGTVFGYHCTHPKKRYRMLAWGMGFLGGICFFISLMTLPEKVENQLLGLAPVLFWLAYYGFQRPGNAGLRGHLLAKPITIALAWAWVTVLLPPSFAMAMAGEPASAQWSELIFLLLGRAAFVFALAIAYDLGDADYDRQHGLATLAGRLGFGKSFRLIYLSLSLAGLCVGANIFFGIYDFSKAIGLFASLIFSTWWLRFVLQKKAWEAWHKPLIDGLMVVQFLLVLLFSSRF